jgi:hypothetical protein
MPQAVVLAAIPAAAALGSSYMADRSNRRGQKAQQKANDDALAFEKQKYEAEQKANAEDRAYRNAIRAAWAKRHGIDWQPGQAWPPGGGSGAPGGGGGGIPKATLMPPPPRLPTRGVAQGRPGMPEEEQEETPAAAWNQW